MKKRNKYAFGSRSLQRRKGVSEYLTLTADRAIECSPVDFGVPEHGGKRTNTEQGAIFKLGYSKADGIRNKSFHQIADVFGMGQALDLVPYIEGKGFDYSAEGRFAIIGMLMLEAWDELKEEGKIPKGLHLHWGGLWPHKDPSRLGWDLAHYEIRDYPQIEKL